MAKPFREWTVLPHGKLTRLEDNMLSVSGVMRMPPMGDVERRMTVVRLTDGRLLVYSAIALDEAEMRALEEFGALEYLIIPSDLHRMDVKIWKDRYPAMTVVAPAGARASVEKIVPVDATAVDFGDPAVRFIAVPGTAEREAALVVETESGTTLILNDLIFDLANRPGLSGWLFKTIGLHGRRAARRPSREDASRERQGRPASSARELVAPAQLEARHHLARWHHYR